MTYKYLRNILAVNLVCVSILMFAVSLLLNNQAYYVIAIACALAQFYVLISIFIKQEKQPVH
jgi:hypothetical protein